MAAREVERAFRVPTRIRAARAARPLLEHGDHGGRRSLVDLHAQLGRSAAYRGPTRRAFGSARCALKIRRPHLAGRFSTAKGTRGPRQRGIEVGAGLRIERAPARQTAPTTSAPSGDCLSLEVQGERCDEGRAITGIFTARRAVREVWTEQHAGSGAAFRTTKGRASVRARAMSKIVTPRTAGRTPRR